MRKLIFYIAILFLFSVVFSTADDKTPPVINYTTDGCGNFKVRITELSAGDVGIKIKPILKPTKCYNVSDITLSPNFIENQPNFDFYFTFYVLNPLDSASFQFYIYDTLGTAESLNIKYTPNVLGVLPESFNFLGGVINDTTYNTFAIVNHHLSTKIVDMKFRKGLYYSISGPKALTLVPNEKYNLIIGYCPKNEGILDTDTLDISTPCGNISYTIHLSGYGVKPLIQVEDIDFGFVSIGTHIRLSDIRGSDSAITIRNPGTSFLNLSKYKLLSGKYFKISSPHNPELDGYTVFAKDSVRFRSIELYAGLPGRITDTLVISSNAEGPDSISVLTAYAVYPGAYLTEYNFGDERLLTSDTGMVYIRNNSDKRINLSGIFVTGDTNDIKVQYSKISPLFINDTIITTLYPEIMDSTRYLTEIKIPVYFKPLTEYNKRIKIALKFAGGDTSSIEIFNYVFGRGTIPKVFAEGHDFQPEVLAGTKYPTEQYIKITNPSTTSDMIVYHVTPQLIGSSGENFFSFPQTLPENLKIAKGQSISIPVEFYPLTDGLMTRYVKITTNCNLLNSPEYYKDTTVILTGKAYKTPVTIELTPLPKINKCSSGAITVKMTNVNSFGAIRIDSIKILDTGDNVFSLADQSLQNGFDIAPAGDFVFNIIYNPAQSDKFLHKEIVKYYYSKYSYDFEVTGDCFSSNISVVLDTIYSIRPGITLNPESTNGTRYSIKIKSTNYTGTTADSFELKLSFNPGYLQFLDKVVGKNGMDLWNLSTKAINKTPDESIISIIGHSSSPLTKFEGVLYPAFETILSDTDKVFIHVKDLIVNDNSTCFTTKFGIGKIYMNACALQFGSLILSNYGFTTMTILPNPITDDNFTVKFSIAFRALTSIEFYNTKGNLIYTPLNIYLEAGEYEMQFSAIDVPAGTYLVKFTSGFFTNSQQIIIIK
ncbi:MAG: T9SS type A sorting domain-containing protein [bacterium]